MAASAHTRKTDYRYTGPATYGDLAYDLDALSREYALRHAGEPVRQEVVAAPAPQTRPVAQPRVRVKQKLSVLSVVGFMVVVALAVVTLKSYVTLTQISTSVVELKSELAALQTENVTLTTKHEQVFELTAVKEAAEANGMTKPSSSQIYYIDMSGSDSAVVYQQEEVSVLSKMLTSLNYGVSAVVEYFE